MSHSRPGLRPALDPLSAQAAGRGGATGRPRRRAAPALSPPPSPLGRPSLRRLAIGLALALSLSAPAFADPTAQLADGTGSLDRRALVAAVLAQNPSIEAARQAWQAALARVPQAGALDDPMLSYGVGPLTVFGDARFGQKLEVAQRIPYPGTLRLRSDRARALAEADAERFASVRLDLALAASQLFDDEYAIERAIEINRQHQALLGDVQRVATARYAAGLAAQQDPLQAEVELTHLMHQGVVLETQRAVVTAQVNALLHRLPTTPLPPPPARLEPAAGADHAGHDALPAERWQQLALAARPELAAADAEIRARETSLDLAGLDRYPDFDVMGSYNSMWAMPEHRWMVGVAVNLPIHRDRIRAGIAEADAELAAARSRRLALADEIQAAIEQDHRQLAEMHHILTLYESRLLPAAADQIRAARSGFETSQTSFLAVIEAEKNQRSVELGYQQALADSHRRLAQLQRDAGQMPTGGEPLPAGSDPARPATPARPNPPEPPVTAPGVTR